MNWESGGCETGALKNLKKFKEKKMDFNWQSF
jgi:hypothetical protein